MEKHQEENTQLLALICLLNVNSLELNHGLLQELHFPEASE